MHAETHTNVDRSELAKFEAVASRWWDPGGEFKTLHDINPLRLQFIDDRCGLQGKHVADIGCGGGILAESMAARGAQVVAIDASEAAINTARLHQFQSNSAVDYEFINPEAFAAREAGKFDVVTCMELLEHVPDPSATVRACAALLKPDGKVFFSTLNRTAQSYFAAVIGAEYLLRLLPKGTHDYARFIRPAELDAWLRGARLVCQDLRGMAYNPFNGRCRLTTSMAINYLACAQRDSA
jgi:2-polyprenyl-6-hydroxyphenyl methylase / 3-demethylubiquinone-9 3-methyltransferase